MSFARISPKFSHVAKATPVSAALPCHINPKDRFLEFDMREIQGIRFKQGEAPVLELGASRDGYPYVAGYNASQGPPFPLFTLAGINSGLFSLYTFGKPFFHAWTLTPNKGSITLNNQPVLTSRWRF